MACSRECGRAMRRIKSESGIADRPRDYKQEPVTSHVIKDLPPWVRLDDTHRGVCGGRYVIVTCQVCGQERQMRISEYRSRERKGFLPRACSLKCAGVLRRESFASKGVTTVEETEPRRPRRKNVPLAYNPKIRGVVDGTVRQTIRIGHKYAVGDLVSFYGWEGVPYRSKWSFRTPYFELSEVIPITLYPGGIEIDGIIKPWSQLDDLASRDGIDPPTGEALGEVLNDLYRIWDRGGSIEAQILRW